MSLPVPPRDCGYDHDHAVALARRDGVTDAESARQFLKHERGVIIHANQPY